MEDQAKYNAKRIGNFMVCVNFDGSLRIIAAKPENNITLSHISDNEIEVRAIENKRIIKDSRLYKRYRIQLELSEKQKQFIGTLMSEVTANGKTPTLTERIERVLRIVVENKDTYLSVNKEIIEQLTSEETAIFSFWTFDAELFKNLAQIKICKSQSKTIRYLLYSYLASQIESYNKY